METKLFILICCFLFFILIYVILWFYDFFSCFIISIKFILYFIIQNSHLFWFIDKFIITAFILKTVLSYQNKKKSCFKKK